MNLANARFGHLENLADFAQIHVLVVVQRQHEFFTLGQPRDRRGERVAKAGVLDVIEGAGALVARVIGGAGLILTRSDLIETEHPAARSILHQLVVVLDGHAESLGDIDGTGILALRIFDFAHDLRHLAHVPMHRTRRPIGLAHLVQHRAPDADSRVGFEIRALGGGIMLGRIQ